MSADEKTVCEDESASSQTVEMKKREMTADELAKLRADLYLRQKAAMVCAAYLTVVHFCATIVI